MFVENDTPHPYNRKITAKEIWDIDKLRLDYYENKGYKVLIVWENKYKQNAQGIINKCIQFLMN